MTDRQDKQTPQAPAVAERIAVNLCRLLLGASLVFSGFVKAIDPIGTQYKIDDYIEAVGLAGAIPSWVTLGTSVALSALEFTLGILTLFAIRRRLVSKLSVVFMAVMTAITVWLAAANPISDCGCFGDAVKLTNTETLLKNIILLAASVAVAWRPLDMVRFISRPNQWIAINYTIIYILATSAYSLYFIPQIDFRPYHVGANLRKGMEIPPGARQPKFETTFTLEKNGVRKEFTLDNYPDSTWTFIDSKTVETERGYEPPIHDFSIENLRTGEDVTSSVVDGKGTTLLLIAPYLEQADDSNFGEIDQIYEYAQDNGIALMCLTASNGKAINHWIDITGAEYPFYATDATTLQTIIRSNPGLVMIKHGTVAGKWSHNNLPDTEELNAIATSKTEPQEPSIYNKVAQAVLLFFIPLLLLTLADRLWAWSKWIRNKENSTKIYQLLKNKQNEKENRSRQLEDEREPAGGHSPGKGNQ